LNRTRITPAPEVLFRETAGQGMLLNLKSGRYYGLDEVGTRLWRLLAKGRSLESAVSQLLEEYDVTRERLESDVERFVETLHAHGLVLRQPPPGGDEPARV
jgi:hypothetical protein